MTLTSEQQAVAQTLHSICNVAAGPGCGKTETIAARVEWLLEEGLPPESIAVVAFTRQAATELRDRLKGAVEVGTLHSVLLGWIERDCGYTLFVTSETRKEPSEQQRIFCALAEEDSAEVAAMRSRMAVTGTVDYTEILVRGLEYVRTNCPVTHLIVDEAQDLDEIQWAIIDAVSDRADVYLVGDENQALYGWRGARVDLWRNRRKHYALTRSFRCPADVMAEANILARRAGSTAPDLVSTKRNGFGRAECAERAVEQLLGDFFAESQIAVLCRYNRTAECVADRLRLLGLNVDREEKASPSPVSTLLQFLHSPQSYEAFVTLKRSWRDIASHRIGAMCECSHSVAAIMATRWMEEIGLPTPAKIIKSLNEFIPEINDEAVEWASRYRGMSLGEAVRASLGSAPKLATSGISVWTIHAAKGREWPAVVAVDDFYRLNDEELRAAYVQITRTKERCIAIPGKMLWN